MPEVKQPPTHPLASQCILPPHNLLLKKAKLYFPCGGHTYHREPRRPFPPPSKTHRFYIASVLLIPPAPRSPHNAPQASHTTYTHPGAKHYPVPYLLSKAAREVSPTPLLDQRSKAPSLCVKMVSQERLPKKGSDFHYASGYNQLFSCGICMGALFRPVEMDCDHCFCEHCIQTHIDREGPVCPVCSKIGSEVTPYKKVTKILNDLVGQLPVTCRRQAEDGTICNQTFKRDALGEHRAVCEFRVITCPKECGASFLRAQLLAHEATCPNNLAFRYASPERPAAAAAAAPLPQQAAPWGTSGSPAASGMDLDTDETAPTAPHATGAQSDGDAVADTPFAADFSTKSSVKRPMGKRAKMLRRHHTPQKTGDDPMQESSPAPSSPGWMAAGTAAAPRTSSPPSASAEPQQPPHVAHQMRSPSVGHTAGFAADASPPPPAGPGTHLPGFAAQQQQQRTRRPDSGSMRSSEGTQSPGQPQPAPHVVWGAQEPVEEFARPSDFGSSSMTDAAPVAPPAVAASHHKPAEPKRTSKKLKIKGDDAYEKGDYVTAIEYWSQAVEIDDGSTKAAVVYGNRSAARYMSQQFQSCIEDCRRALQDDPCNAKLWSRLNKASCCMGDIALSISLLGAAVLEERWDNKPNDRVLVQNEHDNCVMLKQQLEEVAMLTVKGNTRRAEEILTQHQTKCSDWPEYGIAVANLMIAKGDLYGAISAVDKFIALGEERPNGSVVREVLAECFLVKSRATYLNGYDKMKEATRIVKVCHTTPRPTTPTPFDHLPSPQLPSPPHPGRAADRAQHEEAGRVPEEVPDPRGEEREGQRALQEQGVERLRAAVHGGSPAGRRLP